jgi:hypothetical protein
MGPSSGKEQQCGSHAKLSRHRYMCAKIAISVDVLSLILCSDRNLI